MKRFAKHTNTTTDNGGRRPNEQHKQKGAQNGGWGPQLDFEHSRSWIQESLGKGGEDASNSRLRFRQPTVQNALALRITFVKEVKRWEQKKGLSCSILSSSYVENVIFYMN